MNTINMYNEDCLAQLDKLPENSVDAVVTDPPYEIKFMNNDWDKAGIAFNPETWLKVMRVLKQGGYLLSFSHTKRFHRMVVAIEDAGFEIRDTIMWLYGSGFPKSLDVGKMIDKKLGVKRRVIGKAKGVGSNNTSSMNSGKGASQEFASEYDKTIATSSEAKKWDGWGTVLKPAYEPIVMARKPIKGSMTDNVLKHGVGCINVGECRISDSISANEKGRFPANVIHDGSDEVSDKFPYTKEGSVSRFFYTAKASKKERNYGVYKNNHPTVKPIKLMQYLIRLVTPKNGIVLDPFMGSGSTALALLKENWNRNANYGFIGIEKDFDYFKIAEKRITFAKENGIE